MHTPVVSTIPTSTIAALILLSFVAILAGRIKLHYVLAFPGLDSLINKVFLETCFDHGMYMGARPLMLATFGPTGCSSAHCSRLSPASRARSGIRTAHCPVSWLTLVFPSVVLDGPAAWYRGYLSGGDPDGITYVMAIARLVASLRPLCVEQRTADAMMPSSLCTTPIWTIRLGLVLGPLGWVGHFACGLVVLIDVLWVVPLCTCCPQPWTPTSTTRLGGPRVAGPCAVPCADAIRAGLAQHGGETCALTWSSRGPALRATLGATQTGRTTLAWQF